MASKRCEVCLRWVVHVFIWISPLNLIELRESPVEKLIFLLFTGHFNWFLHALRKGHSSRALHLSFAFIRVTQRRCDPPRSKVRFSGSLVVVLKSGCSAKRRDFSSLPGTCTHGRLSDLIDIIVVRLSFLSRG